MKVSYSVSKVRRMDYGWELGKRVRAILRLDSGRVVVGPWAANETSAHFWACVVGVCRVRDGER